MCAMVQLNCKLFYRHGCNVHGMMKWELLLWFGHEKSDSLGTSIRLLAIVPKLWSDHQLFLHGLMYGSVYYTGQGMLAWNEGEARINYLQGDDGSYRIVMCGHCMHVHGCVVQLCAGEFTKLLPYI